jgi:hypothetical protein
MHEIDFNLISEQGKECSFKIRYFSWKLMNRMKKTRFSYLNWKMGEFLNFDIFSWKLMKPYEKDLNLTSELGKMWIFKIRCFFMKTHKGQSISIDLNLKSEQEKEWTFKIR